MKQAVKIAVNFKQFFKMLSAVVLIGCLFGMDEYKAVKKTWCSALGAGLGPVSLLIYIIIVVVWNSEFFLLVSIM